MARPARTGRPVRRGSRAAPKFASRSERARYARSVRPGVARTIVALTALVALGSAGVLVACGSFDSAPAGPPTEPDASATDATPDVADGAVDLSCEEIFRDDFASLAQFNPGSQDAGPAVLDNDPAHAVTPPSLAASASITRGKGNYVNSSGSRDIKLAGLFAKGERFELEYDLFLDKMVDGYGEVGCTFELRNGTGARTRLLLSLMPEGAIDAKVDPADTSLPSLSKTVVINRTPSHYHVRTTIDATNANKALVHYDVTANGNADIEAPLQDGIDRLRLVCGIDYAVTDAAAPVTLRVWVDDVALRRCAPKP